MSKYNFPEADYSQQVPYVGNEPDLHSKWSQHADRWYVWDRNTNNSPSVKTYTATQWQSDHQITAQEEYAMRYGLTPQSWTSNTSSTYYALYKLDTNIETNYAILVPGEIDDNEYNRGYGRPLPPGRTFGASQA